MLERASYRAISEEDVTGRGVKALALDAVPAASLLTYAAERADLPLVLAPDARRRPATRRAWTSVYRELEQPLIPVLADIERAGIKIDVASLAAQGRAMQAQLDELSQRIYALAGGEFNVNSPKQLADVLFEKLNLQPGKKTGKTRVVSTAVDVLEELALMHEMPALVLKWRSIQKLKGTYVDALPTLVNPSTGPRAHDVQPGGRRDRPAEQQRPEPAEHSRSARRPAARSAARSSPSRVTC